MPLQNLVDDLRIESLRAGFFSCWKCAFCHKKCAGHWLESRFLFSILRRKKRKFAPIGIVSAQRWRIASKAAFEPELEPFHDPFFTFLFSVNAFRAERLFGRREKGFERAPSLTGLSGSRQCTIAPKSATRLWERARFQAGEPQFLCMGARIPD